MKDDNIIRHNKSEEIAMASCVSIGDNLKDRIIIITKEDRML